MAKYKEFPNGFESWMETHFEIVDAISIIMNDNDPDENNIVVIRHAEQGRGSVYELAEELTDKFEEANKGRSWDGEFFDEAQAFIEQEMYLNKSYSKFVREVIPPAVYKYPALMKVINESPGTVIDDVWEDFIAPDVLAELITITTCKTYAEIMKFYEGQTVEEILLSFTHSEAIELYRAHITKFGELDYSETELNFLSKELDQIDIGCYGNEPDGEYQEELVRLKFSLTDKDGIALLENRMNIINKELEGKVVHES